MPKRVLIIDDDELILISLEELFRTARIEVLTAAGGEEGLKTAAETTVDAVVLDVIMPGLSGLEVCRRLRKMDAYARTPIVMLTAKSADADRKQGLAAGADRFLPKPFDPAELLKIVREEIGSS